MDMTNYASKEHVLRTLMIFSQLLWWFASTATLSHICRRTS